MPAGMELPGRWFSPDVAPQKEEVLEGLEAIRSGRVLVDVSSYHVDVFDMTQEDDRRRYERTMEKLLRDVQANQCVVWKNELQVLPCKGGVNGWQRYLEWSDYKVSEEAAAAEAAK